VFAASFEVLLRGRTREIASRTRCREEEVEAEDEAELPPDVVTPPAEAPVAEELEAVVPEAGEDDDEDEPPLPADEADVAKCAVEEGPKCVLRSLPALGDSTTVR